jgi:multidrug resistance efflux pump
MRRQVRLWLIITSTLALVNGCHKAHPEVSERETDVQKPRGAAESRGEEIVALKEGTALDTISTDDAYVNGQVKMVAPRVAGQVIRVLVDDNYRVKKGDVLVQIDREPYQLRVDIKQALVVAAERELKAAKAGASAIRQAEAKFLQASSDLEQARLNLHYCDIVSEIDGVVTQRSVSPGNNVEVGQSLMAVYSLTDIWIDANFKETQLANLRIGQRVRCEVDMDGSLREYAGRIIGYSMGTGQTPAVPPPQKATGNSVKTVQSLPVRIELTNYDPASTCLL